MDVLSQLRRHPLFGSLTPEALARIAAVGSAVTLQAGETCVRAGEAGEVFGVLVAGRLSVTVPPPTPGEPARTDHIGPGECFGEMSLLTGNPSRADVAAVEQSQAVLFAQEAVGPLLAGSPAAVRYLARLMTSRLAPGPREAAPRPAAVAYSLGASAPMRVLAVSCRRTDVLYSLFDTTAESARAHGAITGIGDERAEHVLHVGEGPARTRTVAPATHEAVLADALAALTADDGPLASAADISAVGHRVCHGGPHYGGPVVVDDDVLARIGELADLAPMENPHNLTGVAVFRKLLPRARQVAVFDTAFHLRMPRAASRYAVPGDLADPETLRRFGGHGISHEGAARAAAELLGMNFDALRLVTCHLGGGASMCAIDHGRSVDTSMGLTPLEGLVSSTRPGDLDAGLMLRLLTGPGADAAELTRRLYEQSGLLGLSGVSGDVLTVLAAADDGDARALEAVQIYCHRARKYLAGYIGLLGGADAIVFTGGVGRNQPGVRARICQGLEWMGIVLDEGRNRRASVEAGEAVEISAGRSRAKVLVAGTNEQHTIARHTVRALAQGPVTDVMRDSVRPIPIGISAHHVHLTDEHVEALFGEGSTLTWHADLTQPGQFACKQRVTLIGPRGNIDRVRVLGPTRPRTQVEISRTEEYKLGIDAPIRLSGDLDGTPGLTLEGPAGRLELDRGVICAMRHIHMSPADALEFAVRDRDVVRVRVPGDRSLIFGDVAVRVSPDYRLDMHLDTDEANAAQLRPGAVAYLDSIQQRAGR